MLDRTPLHAPQASRLWLLLLPLLWSACVFDGSALTAQRCGDDSTCAPGTTCIDNLCQRRDAAEDAGLPVRGDASDTGDTGDTRDDAGVEGDDAAPDAPEACDAPQVYYADDDEDRFGDPSRSLSGCEAPPGYVLNGDDCDDSDPSIHPEALDTCGDGVDSNCDGDAEEGTRWYVDADGDTWGLTAESMLSCQPPGAGWVTRSGDCDDTQPTIFPDAAEVCDGVDNDCNDLADDDDPVVFGRRSWHPDEDMDGYGNSALGGPTCDPPEGWVSAGRDCDDGEAAVYPTAAEVCNGRDDSCDGQIDEDNAGCPEGTACDGTGCHLPLEAGCSVGAVCVVGAACAGGRCQPFSQPLAVTGQWDFDGGDLTATVGVDLRYRDATTEAQRQYGTTGALGVADINGEPATVLRMPKATPAMGLIADHGVLPERGEGRVNQYSLIFDVLFPEGTNNEWRAFYQTDLNNSTDAELFVERTGSRGIGINGTYHGSISTSTWYRIAVVVDLTQDGPRMFKYINGAQVGSQLNEDNVDGRFSLGPSLLLFADEDEETAVTYVNSIQVRSYAMSPAEVAALGGPTAAGIPR